MSLQSRLAERDAKLDELKGKLDKEEGRSVSLTAQVSEREAKLAELRSQMSSAGNKSTTLHSDLVKRESTISELRSELDSSNSKSASLRSQLSDRDSTVSELRSQLSRAEDRLKARGDSQAELQQLNQDNRQLAEENAGLMADLERADSEIQRLRSLTVSSQKTSTPNGTVSGISNGSSDIDSTAHVDFLNSVIAEMQNKNEELQRKVRVLVVGDEEEDGVLSASGEGKTPARVAPLPRLWCDICEEFDRHETEDCPTQCSGTPEEEPKPSRHGGARGVQRVFCMTCEMFGHSASECDSSLTF